MDKASKAIIQNLMNELAMERQLADQLADALINGGMDRQFQAIAFHEHTRNGFMYGGLKVGNSPESQPKKQAKRGKRSPNHPSIKYKWARPDATNKDFCIQFQQEQDKPYNQEEDKE
jgi:hypothetical protein